MLKVTVGADCGNSPKKLFLKSVNIAFAKGQVQFLIKAVAEDFTWKILGNKFIEGKEAFREILSEMGKTKIRHLLIESIITHGNHGAVNGELTLHSGKKFGFCDIYQFSGTRGNTIKSITSYVIDL